jgi:hypothetical protein
MYSQNIVTRFSLAHNCPCQWTIIYTDILFQNYLEPDQAIDVVNLTTDIH